MRSNLLIILIITLISICEFVDLNGELWGETIADTAGPTSGPCDIFQPGADWCKDCGPCAEGQGDCDSDAECQSGLICAQDVGANYGWPADRDVCERP